MNGSFCWVYEHIKFTICAYVDSKSEVAVSCYTYPIASPNKYKSLTSNVNDFDDWLKS